MMKQKQRSTDKIALLQEQYRHHIPSRIEELKALLQQTRDDTEGVALAELQRKVHSLAGSSGTFGLPLVSSQARTLEIALNAVIGEGRLLSRVEDEYVLNALQRLHEVSLVEGGGASAKTDLQSIEVLSNKLVYILDEDPAICLSLVSELETKGFSVETFETFEELSQRYRQACPAIIIMDQELAGALDAANWKSFRSVEDDQVVPALILLSVRSDINSRLQAVRLGAQRLLVKPVDARQLVLAVSSTLNRTVDEPYRVLIVDDDTELADYYRALLTEVRIDVRAIADPLQCLEVLENFHPELVLMDVYMPGCTGLELAAIIRQDDKYASMPIIFLSTEEKIDRQMAALNLGGDDFITKPVLPAHLLQAVSARLKRSRHTSELNEELANAFKQSSTLRDAMERHNLVSVTDVDGVITYANDNFCQVSGYDREELVGQTHRVVNSGYHGREFFTDMWHTITQGRVWRGTLCNRAKNGTLYWVESTIVPFFDSNGLPYQYVSIRTDITPLKNVEEHLRESRQRLHLSQAFAHMGTWDLNTQTKELLLAENAAPLFGLDEQAVSMNFEDFLSHVHADDEPELCATIKHSIEHGCEYSVAYRYTWPDGSVHWIEGRGDVSRVSDNNGVHLLGIVQDITERKALEINTEQQKALLTLLRTGMSMFMAAQNIGGVAAYLLRGLMELNRSALGFVGEIVTDADENLRVKPHAVLFGANSVYEPLVQGSEYLDEMLTPVFQPVLQGGRKLLDNGVDGPVLANASLGHTVDIANVMTLPIYHGENFVGIFSLMNRAQGFSEEMIEFLQPFIASYGVLINAHRGQVQEQRMREELVVARDAAQRANQMKSQFLSSVSHELRTPLNAILGFGQLLQVDGEKLFDEEQRENVQEILNAGDHLLRLVDDILDLARIEAGKIALSYETVELGAVVESTLLLLRPLAKMAQISLEYDAECFQGKVIWVDQVRLKQVLINLLSNAIKYNRQDGSVVISCHCEAADFLVVSITDTGAGIPRDRISEIFTPFGRLDAESRGIPGTGIGLVLSREMVQIMGGRLEVESEEEVGTTFKLYLPLGSS